MENATKGVEAFRKEDLIGKVLTCESVQEVDTKYGKKKLYIVKTDDGKEVAFYGTPVIDKQNIQTGDVFKLEKIWNKSKTTKYWIAKAVK